jgi:serine/threonine protein kinase
MKSNDNGRTDLDDPRVVAALDEYLSALESGHKPDRKAFLAQHAAIADALAECLDGMEALHADVKSSEFGRDSCSSSPQSSSHSPLSPDWQPGAPLGDYRIVREIGRGGMGVVYEAEQLSLGRRIALKVLPFALTLDPRQLQRFKNEARAAAQLHHQHIVPVYAVGSERGVHFYAMQYIEGQSLGEVIHDLQRQAKTKNHSEPALSAAKAENGRGPRADRAATTGPYLPHEDEPAPETAIKPIGALATSFSANSSGFYRSAARLGIQAAEALQHAHEYGVVHRDIKPGNLMVDAHGHLWITDFGLAQFQADAGLTQTGDLLGTLRYMSPEQAGGQRFALDHRTDIYSLGATLYELLTLHPPFEAGDRQTLLHQILNDEPYLPRTHRKSIPIELETIVLKAIAKTPADRYASAREFADDLKRFLENEPIRARRATAAQRARKWAQRHPSVVWAAVLLCLLTAGGSLIGAELLRREQLKTQKAYQQVDAAYRSEKQRAREAEEEYRLARDAVDGMFKLCEEELSDKPFLDGLRRRLLQDYFLVYYQKLIEQRRDDPEAQAQLSANRERVSEILDNLAELQGVGLYVHLHNPAVVDDLQPRRDQRERIWQLTEKMRERGRNWFKGLFGLTADQRREQLLKNARETEREAQNILDAEQRKRLRQIDLQFKGPRAFEEADVILALHLDAAQKEQIRAIQWEAFSKEIENRRFCPPELPPIGGRPFGPPPEGPRDGRPPEMKEKMSAPDTVEKIVKNVLNEEQQKKWRELTGKRFEKRFEGRPGVPFGQHPHGRGGPPRRNEKN